MSQADLLAYLAKIFDALQVRWMLVGSHASSHYGEPRSTHDVDVVLELSPRQIDDLLSRIDQDRYYLSRSALQEGRMANLIDTHTSDKVDLFLATDNATTQRELARIRYDDWMGLRVPFPSVEDVILSKLRWNRDVGGSERQIRDVRAVVRLQRPNIDWTYLNSYLESEGFAELWQREIMKDTRD